MSDTNITGCVYGTRQGSVPAIHTLTVSSSTSTTATKWLTIQASAAKPVVIEGQIVVQTADGGTSPTMSLGYTASGYTDVVNAASTATGATGGTFLPASNATGKKLLVADTDIYYKQGGTPNGAGVTHLILQVFSINKAAA